MKRALRPVRGALGALCAMAAMLLCTPALAQDTGAAVGAATGGAAPGGIFLRTRAPSLAPVRNLRYDAAAKAISTDDWVYPLPVSPSEADEIFRLVAKQDFLAADVSTRGDAALFGLSREGKIANRMLIADLLLGDIAKGYGYFAPIYRTAQDYKPKQYNPTGRQQFAVFFVFASEAWRVDGKTLVSQPNKLEAIGVPTIRQPDGTRRFDFEALKRNIQDDAIAENTRHITANEAYYRRERAVRDMQSFADVAQLARELRQQSIDIAGLLKQ
jgi:hypothetical protein